MEYEKYYSLNEVADILKVHYNTVLRWITLDKLNATKVGDSWRVSESQLNKFLGKQE